MLRAMAVIANGGYLVRPYVVDRVLDSQGRLVEREEPERVRVLSSRTTGIIRNALEMVVSKGTGKKAAVAGYRVAGKTGTAQKYDPELRTYSPTEFVSSYVGFAPADHPSSLSPSSTIHPIRTITAATSPRRSSPRSPARC